MSMIVYVTHLNLSICRLWGCQ